MRIQLLDTAKLREPFYVQKGKCDTCMCVCDFKYRQNLYGMTYLMCTNLFESINGLSTDTNSREIWKICQKYTHKYHQNTFSKPSTITPQPTAPIHIRSPMTSHRSLPCRFYLATKQRLKRIKYRTHQKCFW